MAAQLGPADKEQMKVLRRMKIGAGALILEPWNLVRRKPAPPAEETWSPFEGARNVNRGPFSKWMINAMRRRNKSINRQALDTLMVAPKDHVLEIGYGSGDALGQAAKMARSGFAAGIDRSLDMLAAGYKRTKRSKNKNLSVLRGDVSWLPWGASAFDKAYCVDGITEWPCTRSGLEELHRVLRPGGTLVLAEHINKTFTKSKALALAHLLTVVGFQDLEVRLEPEQGSELLLLRAIRN
jgi:SAM-dependent methyltransferase